MSESQQHKLDRIRKPRVHITYDVEIGDAIQLKELPFTVGVMADLSGHMTPEDKEKLGKLKDRKFVEIDRDNFNQVLAGTKPRLAMRVADKLSGEKDKQLNVELKFRNMDDFEPERVVNQVEPLKKLLETRNKLKDLLAKMDGNDRLEEKLKEILENTDLRDKLAAETGAAKPEEGSK
jgi:type VI secretion system protein ImpB